MPRTCHPNSYDDNGKAVNLATIYTAEICQLILDHLLLLALSDTSPARRLMHTCTDLLNTVSTFVYKRVTLHEGNADKFFYGLAGGNMRQGEVKDWHEKNEGRLEKKSVVAIQLIWLSMVRRVEIMATPALMSCVAALKALLKRPFGTPDNPPISSAGAPT
ncbi:hypothetical protein IAR50_007054 [Cryptococcus sp. DSM 104548]